MLDKRHAALNSAKSIEKHAHRGGARPGAGRPRSPLKNVQMGAEMSQKLYRDLECEKKLRELFPKLSPSQQLGIIFKLREYAWGRPGTEEPPKQKQVEINVNVRRIGA